MDKIYLDDVNKDALRLTNESHSGADVIITHQDSLNLKYGHECVCICVCVVHVYIYMYNIDTVQ